MAKLSSAPHGVTTVRLALENPAWLWLLVFCVPVIWIVAVAWPVERRGIRWTAAAIRTVLLAGLVVAAARPVRFIDTAAVSAVALFDVSASISEGELTRERQLARQLLNAARDPHQLRILRFATEPSEIVTPSHTSAPTLDSTLSKIAHPIGDAALGTDIARALALAVGLADPAGARRVLLVSDGRPTAGDALAQAARLADLGVRVDTIGLGSTAAAGDVAIDSLSAPSDIRPHATFPLGIRIAADRPTRVRLILKRDGQPVDAPRRQSVAAGETTLTWNTRVENTSTSIFSAHIADDQASTTTPDAHPENDQGILAITVDAPARVLIVAGHMTDAAPLAQALRAQSIDTDVSPRARAVEALDATALARADLVVLADLPRPALTNGVVGRLDTYVRDGGGLLVTGGPNAFGPGGWTGSGLESLLPVRLDLPDRRDEPTLALALVIDRSGSMSGPKMELTRKAARATAEMLPPDDLIAIVAFDSQATTVVPLQPAANRMRIAADIGRIQPTGGTNILAGLREAVDQLGTSRAKKKHAILISDGQSATEGIADLVDTAAASRITISTIGVGDGVDDGLLQLIARRGGGRYYHTRDPASIPRIFTREASAVATTGVVERPTTVVPRQRSTMLNGLSVDRTPLLGGYVRTRARAQADLLLATDSGDPLLARWSVGLGQVVAWTSDLGPRWADAWARWPPYTKFWGQVARATMRARAAKRFPLTARVDGGIVDVSIEAVGDNDQFLSGLDATLEITDVGGVVPNEKPATRRIALSESAPGRYEARFPVAPDTGARPGALLLRAKLDRDGRPVAQANGHLSIPFAPELRPVAATATATNAGDHDLAPFGPDLLAAIAARTGGGALKSPDDLFRGAAPRRTSQSLRTPLLVALALLFIVDVAMRRLAGMRRGRPPHQPDAR